MQINPNVQWPWSSYWRSLLFQAITSEKAVELKADFTFGQKQEVIYMESNYKIKINFI